MTQNIAFRTIRYVLIDLIGDILYWPVWWYSKGLLKAGLFCLREIKNQEERLGLTIWMKNIFTPMFGQYDIEGRIISFFMRLIQIIARSIFLAVWAAFMLILFTIWIILPLIAGYQLFINLAGIITF